MILALSKLSEKRHGAIIAIAQDDNLGSFALLENLGSPRE